MALEEKAVEGSESPYVSKFLEFFEANYKKELERLVENYPDKRSLEVVFRLLEQFDIELADAILDSPELLLEAAKDAIEQIEVPALEIETFSPHVRFFNIPKEHEPLVRDISAAQLGKFIAVEGVVRQITTVLPKLKVAVWKCRHCGNTYEKVQDDQQLKIPSFCECRHRDFDLVPEQSEFIDSQRIEIQEPLERLKGNEQASTLQVYIADDLVNRISAGDKTRFTGILRLAVPDKKKTVYGRYLEAFHLEETQREFLDVEISPEEEKEIKDLASSPDIYETLTKSIAPAIYGHEKVKESIILQLFGGVKKNLPGNQTVRGNIHVLLVGDPGCLVADERIVLGNGAIEKIGSIGSRHLEEINLQVLTGQGGAKRDTATVFHYYKSQPVIEIVTESGKSIKGTPNHPLLCVSKENSHVARNWKRLDEFREGDKVAVVTGIPCTITNYVETGFKPLPYKGGNRFKGKLPEKVTLELASFLGYMVGDGWVRKYETAFVVADNEKELLEPLLKMCENLFAIKSSVVRRKLEGRKIWLNYASIYSRGISQNLIFLREKRVPSLIFRSGNKVVASFLKWLFTADGCVFNNGRGRRAVSFKAKNIELLRDLQVLLLRFGIHGRITGNSLQIRRGRDIIKFAKKIGFASKKKRATLKKLAEEARSFARFNSQRSEKIVKIIQHEPEDVFDIEVPGSHRFIANGVISHNTGKSQLLQAANTIAPKSIYTAGKTTSGVGLCVAPDSLVLNDNGFKRIEDFVEENFCNEKALEEIPNAWSNGFDGKSVCLNRDLRLVEGNIHKIWRIKAPEKMVRIRTRPGKQLELTPNTPLIRIKENKVKWVKSADLLQGDFVACSRISPEGNECNASNPELSESISKIKSLEAKRLKKKPITAEESRALAESDLIWEEIAQKEHFKPDYEFVYDFSVEKNHNFVANGIFVHNTASAVKDDFGEGGWTLKAGALVLASGGVCMVDELDKMEAEDRSAMHEAMEQGMISIAKAGIVTRFKSDTSILAAANPKMSRFEPYQPFIEQINLPASLISRFDLFFMIKDVLDKTKDEAITAHILKTHKGGEMISQYKQKGRVMLKQDQDDIDIISSPPIQPELLGKYISYARQNVFPIMSKEAIQLIGDFYIGLRDIGRKEGSYAATHRQLEGLVRLSEASARVRLSDIAEKEDAERAIRLVKASLSDVVTDPETGKIDYDIIMTGQTHTQVTNMRKILTILREKAREQDNVPLQDVLNEASAQGIDAERARDLIAKLEKNGELYRPRHNFLKPTRGE